MAGGHRKKGPHLPALLDDVVWQQKEFRKCWMGKGPGSPGKIPAGIAPPPWAPVPMSRRSCSRVLVSQRAVPPRCSSVLGKRGPPPGCHGSDGIGCTLEGASQPPPPL